MQTFNGRKWTENEQLPSYQTKKLANNGQLSYFVLVWKWLARVAPSWSEEPLEKTNND